MAYPVRFRPEAKRDIRAGHDWFESERAGLGNTFVRSVDAVIERIRRRPACYAMDVSGVRIGIVRRFSYIVVYVFENDEIEVIAVAHGHRDPYVWESRLK